MADAEVDESPFLRQCRQVARSARANFPDQCFDALQLLYRDCKSPDGTALFDGHCLAALKPIVLIEFTKIRPIIFTAIRSIAAETKVDVPDGYFPDIRAEITPPVRSAKRVTAPQVPERPSNTPDTKALAAQLRPPGHWRQ